MALPSREHKWTNMKGLKYNLTNHQAYVRNYVLSQARKLVMKQTNGLYPAPLRILEVCITTGDNLPCMLDGKVLVYCM